VSEPDPDIERWYVLALNNLAWFIFILSYHHHFL
jgi:hypothetical protein